MAVDAAQKAVKAVEAKAAEAKAAEAKEVKAAEKADAVDAVKYNYQYQNFVEPHKSKYCHSRDCKIDLCNSNSC